MKKQIHNPRILMVTSEVTFLRHGMRPGARVISARASGLGDVCTAHIEALYDRGLDVHLAMPNYRNLLKINAGRIAAIDIYNRRCGLPESNIHLAQDRSFYYHPKLCSTTDSENVRIALTFQREVINRIIPEVQPDLILCYDWTTGLIPAMARVYEIPCLFTLYHLDSPRLHLSTIEDQGIDAASFWQHCYYCRMPVNYQETRNTNPLDMLSSGVFAADSVNLLSDTLLHTLTDGSSQIAGSQLKVVLNEKLRAGTLTALAPVPDSSHNPSTDRNLVRAYGPQDHVAGKLFNKIKLQETLHLRMDSNAPLLFWPTHLDGSRSGCRLMIEVLPDVLDRYREQGLQIVFFGDGEFQESLHASIESLKVADRVSVSGFDIRHWRLAYGGADYVLMPLLLASCGLPCQIGQRYGALPIAHDAGAIHDCVEQLEPTANHGTGFLFKHFGADGFLWAIDQAMDFYSQPQEVRSSQMQRIMTDSLVGPDPDDNVRKTLNLYARVLDRSPANFGVSPDNSVPFQIAV